MGLRFDNLPREISSLIQSFLGLDEFYISLSVSRSLRTNGLSSRTLLLQQLEKLSTPSVYRSLKNLKIEHLRDNYLIIAKEDLRGSNVYGDITTYMPSYGCIDLDITTFRSGRPKVSLSPLIGIAYEGLALIHVYRLTQLGLIFEHEIRPYESPALPQDGSWRLRKITFLRDDHGTLITLGSHPVSSQDIHSPGATLEEQLSIVSFRLELCLTCTTTHELVRRETGGRYLGISITTEYPRSAIELYMSPDESSMTTLQETSIPWDYHTAMSHSELQTSDGLVRYCHDRFVPVGERTPRVYKWPIDAARVPTRFEYAHETQLMYYAKGYPVPTHVGWRSRLARVQDNLHFVEIVDGREESTTEEAMHIGPSFIVYHEPHNATEPDICKFHFTSIAIHRSDSLDSHKAFLATGCDSFESIVGQHCELPDLFSSLDPVTGPVSWLKVASLEGYEQGSTRNGTIIAMSAESTESRRFSDVRIAAAFNRRVLIWSCDSVYLGRLSAKFWSDGGNRDCHPLKIWPVELENDMDICRLIWSDDTSLVAISGQGIRQWRLGPGRKGQRIGDSLAGPLIPGKDYSIPTFDGVDINRGGYETRVGRIVKEEMWPL